MYGVWKIIWSNISSASQIVPKLLDELKSQGELIFEETQNIGFLLVFSGNETLSLHCKSENYSFMWDIGN